jgi:hypothetical protein
MASRPLLLAFLGLALTACTTLARHRALETSNSDLTTPDVLLATDLVHAQSATVYEAVLEVRPHFFDRWLATSTHDGARGVRVYLDNIEMGDLDALRTIPLGPVTSVRYVDPADARFRWGRAASGAVIMVTTAR